MFSETPTRERMFFLPNGNKRAKCVELPMENIKKTETREIETGDLKQQESETSLILLPR